MDSTLKMKRSLENVRLRLARRLHDARSLNGSADELSKIGVEVTTALEAAFVKSFAASAETAA